jgi:hypothetical protein
MKVLNNTPVDAFVTVSSPNSTDCGTINSQGTNDWPYYNNQENVTVSFAALPPSQPPQITPFKITIPETGTGMAVTIGIYQE